MPRVEAAGFVGGLGSHKAKGMSSEDLWNGIVEPTGPPIHGKTPGYLRRIPGVSIFGTIPNADSVRGLYAADGRMFAVGGTTFLEVFEDGTTGPPFTVVEDDNPATISPGGAESQTIPDQINRALLVVSGGTGIVYDLDEDTETAISAPGLTPPYSMGLVIDLYGVVVKEDSIQFNFSNNDDFSVFDASDFAARSEASDNISAMVRSHRELVMLGTQTSEVWQDAGQGNDIFLPIPGTFVEQGCIAPYSALNVDNTVYWLGQDKDGTLSVYKLNGYTPERVSNFAVEYTLGLSSELADTIAWSMKIGGHLFYGLYVPDLIGPLGGQLVFDIATGYWARWALWDSDEARWYPWFARCHCFAFGKHLIGDRSTGTIYEVSIDSYANTVPI